MEAVKWLVNPLTPSVPPQVTFNQNFNLKIRKGR